MIILVSDTSVLIDLERGGLLEPAFSCDLTMVVPDLLFARELEAENGPLLRTHGLGVVALNPDEVDFAQQLRKLRPGLSLPDCFALSCARRQGHALVSGDKLLRAEAQARHCVVYGLLWVLDQMEASGKVMRVPGPRRPLSDHYPARIPGARAAGSREATTSPMASSAIRCACIARSRRSSGLCLHPFICSHSVALARMK